MCCSWLICVSACFEMETVQMLTAHVQKQISLRHLHSLKVRWVHDWCRLAAQDTLRQLVTTKRLLFTESLVHFKRLDWVTSLLISKSHKRDEKMAFTPEVCNSHSWVVKSCEKVKQVHCKVLNWCLTAQVFCLSATVNCTSGRPNDTLYPSTLSGKPEEGLGLAAA